MSDSPKRTILAITPKRKKLQTFFNELASQGFEIQHHEEKEKLLEAAAKMSQEGKPVAVICDNKLSQSPAMFGQLMGQDDGEKLATALAEACPDGKTLTVIYAGDVRDKGLGLKRSENPLSHRQAELQRQLGDHQTDEAEKVARTINKFFAQDIG